MIPDNKGAINPIEQEKVFVTPKTVPEIAGAISDTIGVAPPVSKPIVDMESIRRITTNTTLHPAIGISTRAKVGPIKAEAISKKVTIYIKNYDYQLFEIFF